MKSKGVQSYTIPLPHKIRAHFHASHGLFLPRKLAEEGIANYEPLSLAAFLATAESIPGSIFDIGANIGVYSLMVSAGLRRHVVACEPFDEPAKILEGIARYESLPIEVRQVAVSEHSGRADFHVSTKSDMSNSLIDGFRDSARTISVAATTIDEMSLRQLPAAIKIDVESAEMMVLRGATKTLSRDRPAILIEVLTDSIAHEVRGFLGSFNYHILEIGADDFGKKFDVTTSETSGDARNWLALGEPPSDKFYKRTKDWLHYIRTL